MQISRQHANLALLAGVRISIRSERGHSCPLGRWPERRSGQECPRSL